MSSVQNILFNPSVGIDELLAMPDAQTLPGPKDLAAGMLRETTLESLYRPVNSHTLYEQLLCPNLGDGRLVTPDEFRRRIEQAAQKLRGAGIPEIEAFFHEDLEQLLINDRLAAAYRNLMVGG